MRKTWMIGLAAALGLGGACKKADTNRDPQSNPVEQSQKQPDLANQQPAPQPAPNEPARSQAQQQTTTGRVARVGTMEIVVEQPGQPQLHVRVDSGVPVTVDGEKAALIDVPVGSDANILIQQQGDQAVAKRIDAMTRQPVRGTEEQPK